MIRRRAVVIAAGLTILLGGCSSRQVLDVPQADRLRAYTHRQEILLSFAHWEMQGRLAINDGKDGGSGSLTWRTGPGVIDMKFRGALGRGAWQLSADSDGAELAMADGAVHRAETLEQLVIEHVGWKVPVNALRWWVRGLAGPGSHLIKELDEGGRLEILEQGGWKVIFADYRDETGIDLPRRVTAQKDEHSVKLVVRKWDIWDASGSE